MSVFTFVLGNKNEVLAALLAGVLTYGGYASAAAVVEDRSGAGRGRVVFGGVGFLPRVADFGDRRGRVWRAS
jgi:hypothetical protein